MSVPLARRQLVARKGGTLETEGGRIRRLVDDLQKVSRAEERLLDLRVEPVAPRLIVTDAVRAAGPAYAAKGVVLDTAVPDRLPMVAVDKDRIGEVLANLLDNALRHTPPGGRVEVTADGAGNEVELTVSDSGEGIEPEHLSRVFERFYRVDSGRARARGGSGIGLAIARALVEAHDGRLRAESEGLGTGARFVVTIPTRPRVTSAAQATTKARAPEP